MKPKILLPLILVTLLGLQGAGQSQPKKIQVAILLDVSNSMDGLIDQAKSQLWNMVTVLGRAECQGLPPSVEIALYEYGRNSNNQQAGYVKQLSGFTTDLDKLSAILFGLSTNGGDEYCGQVIQTAVEGLQWDGTAGNYRVIFIAGNEDFLQGEVQFTGACQLARQKGIIVNTIYCGDKATGIREHWNLGSECGNGSFTNIDQGAKEDDIVTPYDSTIYALNSQLNQTYVAYGAAGEAARRRQAEMDKRNASLSRKAGLGRVAVKASRGYSNTNWDLVDAYESDSTVLARVESESLPAEYRNISRQKLTEKLKSMARQRGEIQEQIGRTNQQRLQFITAEKKRNATSAAATLETEVEKILREQAGRYEINIR